MTIQEAINKVKEEKPNTFTNEKMLSFINEIETEVAHELDEEFEPYETVDSTELLAPNPYSRLYISYLKAMVDFSNEEYPSYQVNQMQHVQDYGDFVDWIVRDKVAVEHVIPSRFRNIF